MKEKFSDVEIDASLQNYNTYGIKTSCKYLIKPIDIEELQLIISSLEDDNIPYIVLGKGSNVILPDTKFNGAIINLEHLNKIEINDTLLSSFAGITLSHLVREAINHNLKGLEDLANIPGTLGGALVGNAGVKLSEIYDHLQDITYLEDGKIYTVTKDKIKYSYRTTEFQNSKRIIISANFNLTYGNKDAMLEIVKSNQLKRLESQPLEYKNAGSTFKNPVGMIAGKLIEDAGLKGLRVNDACVSSKHANFIVNLNNATSKDILELIDLIKEKVYNTYGIKLELEQKIIEWD